jgi:hypothetical protein
LHTHALGFFSFSFQNTRMDIDLDSHQAIDCQGDGIEPPTNRSKLYPIALPYNCASID